MVLHINTALAVLALEVLPYSLELCKKRKKITNHDRPLKLSCWNRMPCSRSIN